MDLTFNSTKSVGIARELGGPDNAGDPLIEDAHREAVEYAMGFVEADMQARVRVGGADHDRLTGNMVAYRVTHRDTRINADDKRPDMSLHCHVFVFNTTFDAVEKKWKACQMGQIKHDANYYESIFHNRLASNLRDLGYGIRRDKRAFEIEGIDRPLIEKFSRRTKQINELTAKLNIQKPESKAKLGATTRLGKTKELVEDLNAYFVSRLTTVEKHQLSCCALASRPLLSLSRGEVSSSQKQNSVRLFFLA
jgi:conjugative relaxase-like TrwC/TraI family protein